MMEINEHKTEPVAAPANLDWTRYYREVQALFSATRRCIDAGLQRGLLTDEVRSCRAALAITATTPASERTI